MVDEQETQTTTTEEVAVTVEVKPENKFIKFLKEAWEWIVAVLIVISGWFIIQKFLNKKTDAEQTILDNIQHNDEQANQLQHQVDANMQHEQELAQQQQQVQQQIDQLDQDVQQHTHDFQEQEQQIHQDSQNHQANIDYLNKKYKKKRN